MARKCDLTGKRPNVANKVSHSNIKTKKRQLPNIQKRKLWYAEESRFDGRFNFDYVADGNKAKFIIGGSLLYSFWRMDEHLAIFNNYTMALFSQFSNIPPGENNVVRGGGLGLGANLGVEYRINQKIVSQIMYQPYHSSVDYGVSINKRILLQHDIIVRFLWK